MRREVQRNGNTEYYHRASFAKSLLLDFLTGRSPISESYDLFKYTLSLLYIFLTRENGPQLTVGAGQCF